MLYLQLFLAIVCSIACSTILADYVESHRSGDIIYSAHAFPNKITRYDLSSESFLTDIPLNLGTTAFIVGESNIYIASNHILYSISKSGGTAVAMYNFSMDMNDLTIVGDYLLVSHPGVSGEVFSTFRISDNSYIGTFPGHDYASAVAGTSNNTFFYRNMGSSAKKILKRELNTNGELTSTLDPYHYGYPDAQTLFIFPDENRVIDNGGTIYYTDDLEYAGSVGGAFDAVTFFDNYLVIARETELTLFSNTLIELGFASSIKAPSDLFKYNDSLILVSGSGINTTIETIALTEFALPEAEEPIDPNNINFIAEFYQLNSINGMLYLVDLESLSVFGWDSTSQSYSSSWRLTSTPIWITLSEEHNRLYLGYSNGRITYFDLSHETTIEKHFITLPTSIRGLLSAGNYLFVGDSANSSSHYSIDVDGNIIDSSNFRRSLGNEYIWNPTTERIYLLTGGSPKDIEWASLNQTNGLLESIGDSPYHDSSYVVSPIRVSGDQQFILMGTGNLHDATDLTVSESLPNTISDATWIGSNLFTVRTSGNQFYLQYWGNDLLLDEEFRIPHSSNTRVFSYLNNLILVTTNNETELSSFDPYDLPDQDEDEIIDLRDNCKTIPNTSQSDWDLDFIGDDCDEDADNDGIPNEIESTNGMNPFDDTDIYEDLDGDEFTNLVEFRLNTGINDAESKPEIIEYYFADFDNYIIPSELSNVVGSEPWELSNLDYYSSSRSIKSGAISENQSSAIKFLGYFAEGTFSFRKFSDQDWQGDLFLIIDGDENYVGSSSNWIKVSFNLTEGFHELVFKFETTRSGEIDDVAFIDDIQFHPLDADQDGVPDAIDNCVYDSNPSQENFDDDNQGDACDYDDDNDGAYDSSDNCLFLANPNQENFDGDSYGNACDPDDDNDGVFDEIDNCEFYANPFQENFDGDSLGDICDPDDDNDGIVDNKDNCENLSNPLQLNYDDDDFGDVCDPDDDNDSVTDDIEEFYKALDPLNTSDIYEDYDGDGISNIDELKNGTNPDVSDLKDDDGGGGANSLSFLIFLLLFLNIRKIRSSYNSTF